MSKSSMEDVIEATRIVNKLDKRGKLAILRDLQKQGLEPCAKVRTDEPERPIAVHEMRLKGKTITAATVEPSTGTSAKVPVTYTEGGEK